MDRVGKKCVLYSRVSTEMQVDGFSLAGQKTCLTRYVEREEMKVVGEYEDAGKSGKSIEGRPAFKRMLNDIKEGLQVDYVIVYKLSRFGRNAADVLNSLELIQDYGVNLICTDEGIDSSQASGRLLISVLSAVAQIERENILEQTMNGRREKARQGLWNGGQAPYGYKLENGMIVVNPEEAEVVKTIFEKYANTTLKMSDVARYCNEQNFIREHRGNIVGGFWSDTTIRKILDNKVYIGLIEWGHRTNVKVKGSKEMKRVYTKDNIVLAEGKHEAIISKELFDKCQQKRDKIKEKMHIEGPREGIHVLSGLLRCPICGRKMICAMSGKVNKDGSRNIRRYYICSGSNSFVKKCSHTKLYDAIVCETLVKNALSVIVNNEDFMNNLEKEFIADNQEALLTRELENYQKKLKDKYVLRTKLENEIDNMDSERPDFEMCRKILNDRLFKMYEEIFSLEESIDKSKNKLRTYENDLISANYIASILRNFSEFFDKIELKQKKELLNALISKIEINERKEGDKDLSLKSIEFNFPVFKNPRLIEEAQKEDLALIPVKEAVARISTVVDFNQEGKIQLDSVEIPYLVKKSKEEIIRIKDEKNRLKEITIAPMQSNKQIIEYVKSKYNIIVYGRIIRTIKKEIGINYRHSEDSDCSFDNVKISYEKFDAVVDALKALKLVPKALIDNFDDIVNDARNRIPVKLKPVKERVHKPYYKKKKVTNEMIIDFVKDNHNLVVNPSMISYVRDELGICVKKKDWRYDPTFKNKRVPKHDQYSAIKEAMEKLAYS